MLEFNIAPNTQVGKIEIPNKVYKFENLYGIEEEKYSRGGEFIENMVTDNIIEFCNRWFNLANYQEFLEDIDEFYSGYRYGNFSNLRKAGFGESPILPTINGKDCPIEFINAKVEVPIEFITKHPEQFDTIIKTRKGL